MILHQSQSSLLAFFLLLPSFLASFLAPLRMLPCLLPCLLHAFLPARRWKQEEAGRKGSKETKGSEGRFSVRKKKFFRLTIGPTAHWWRRRVALPLWQASTWIWWFESTLVRFSSHFTLEDSFARLLLSLLPSFIVCLLASFLPSLPCFHGFCWLPRSSNFFIRAQELSLIGVGLLPQEASAPVGAARRSMA